jgi:hypothetical protein
MKQHALTTVLSLQMLQTIPIDLASITSSKIGITINQLRKSPQSGVATVANTLKERIQAAIDTHSKTAAAKASTTKDAKDAKDSKKEKDGSVSGSKRKETEAATKLADDAAKAAKSSRKDKEASSTKLENEQMDHSSKRSRKESSNGECWNSTRATLTGYTEVY